MRSETQPRSQPEKLDPSGVLAGLAAGRKGILWMLATIMMFVAMDSIAKYLGPAYPVTQIVWARYMFHAVVVVAYLGHRLPGMMRTKRLGLQLTRSLLVLGSTICAFIALRYLPIADIVAVWTITPILVTALSYPVLKEYVGPRRWAGVCIGFIGALIMLRPGFGVFEPAVILAIGSALCMAFFNLVTRALSASDPPLTTLTYTAVVGLVVSSATLPFAWVAPDFEGWTLMVVLGLLGGVSHFTLIKAFASATAATVMPFTYTNLIWATLVGYFVFGDLPDLWTVGGALLIVASGLYIFYREHRNRAPS